MSNLYPKCPGCEEHELVEIITDDDVYYRCPDVDACGQIIPNDEYQQMVKELKRKRDEKNNAVGTQTSRSTVTSNSVTLKSTTLSSQAKNHLPGKSTPASSNQGSSVLTSNSNASHSAKSTYSNTNRSTISSKSAKSSSSRKRGGDDDGTGEDEDEELELEDDDDDEELSETSSSDEDEKEGEDETDSDSENMLMSQEMSQLYQENRDAMLSGDIEVQRTALLPGLTIRACERELSAEPCRRAYRPPQQDLHAVRRLGLNDPSKAGRFLGMNRRAMQYNLVSAFKKMEPMIVALPKVEALSKTVVQSTKPDSFQLPADFKPLVVWEPLPEDTKAHPELEFTPIEVPPRIARWLRPHQREGVQFLAECVLEQRDFEGAGAILADDMGLGKTLQSVTLIYTLLTQGFLKDQPIAQKIIVCCPTALVLNWANEFTKWVGPGIVKVLALTDSGKDSVESGIDEYVDASRGIQVLVISYDTFRRYVRRINRRGCDLLVCDEAHRLKNANTLTYTALNKLSCKRRVLLSGTPMQNDLGEFFAMVDFTNPGVLGDQAKFGRYFQGPILRGREPDASEKEKEKGNLRAAELSQLVNKFILRRTNVLLSKHLPPKVVQIVCCAFTPLQKRIYEHFVNQPMVKQLLNNAAAMAELEKAAAEAGEEIPLKSPSNGGQGVQVLPLIGLLKALVNHPKLVWDVRKQSKVPGVGPELEALFPKDFDTTGAHPRFSGKMMALDRLLCEVKANTDDKWVLVSNYTQTLDLFEALCKFRGFGFVRLDGSTSIKKRQALVDELTAKGNNIYVFLLSSKAGGCGLNLIGANRLVLFDPDWNPAVDKQAAARIWRDGQKKRCFVYRFLGTNSIEEKVYQRQLSKEGLQDVMGGNNTEAQVSRDDLRDLFSFKADSGLSSTHDTLDCSCLQKLNEPPSDDEEVKQKSKASDEEDDDDDVPAGAMGDSELQAERLLKELRKKRELEAKKNRPRLLWGQRGRPTEEDLVNWSHHYTVQTVPDPMFRRTHSTVFVEKQGNMTALKGGFGSMSKPQAMPVRASLRIRLKPNKEDSSDDDEEDEELTKAIAASTQSSVASTGSTTATHATPTKPAGGLAGSGSSSSSRVRVGLSSAGADAATARSLHPNATGPRGGFEPVTFVFACEVHGREITGPVEEECKRVSCIRCAEIPRTPRQIRKEQALAAAKSQKEQKAAAEKKTSPEGNPDQSNDMDESDQLIQSKQLLESEDAGKARGTDKPQQRVELVPRSRIPSYIVPARSPTLPTLDNENDGEVNTSTVSNSNSNMSIESAPISTLNSPSSQRSSGSVEEDDSPTPNLGQPRKKSSSSQNRDDDGSMGISTDTEDMQSKRVRTGLKSGNPDGSPIPSPLSSPTSSMGGSKPTMRKSSLGNLGRKSSSSVNVALTTLSSESSFDSKTSIAGATTIGEDDDDDDIVIMSEVIHSQPQSTPSSQTSNTSSFSRTPSQQEIEEEASMRLIAQLQEEDARNGRGPSRRSNSSRAKLVR